MAAVLPDTPWPVGEPPMVETAGCSDKRGHGDHYTKAGWVWCGRCVQRLWPDPNRPKKAGLAFGDPVALARAARIIRGALARLPRPNTT